MKKIYLYLVIVIVGYAILFVLQSNSPLKLEDDSGAVLGNLKPIEQHQLLFNLKWKNNLDELDINIVRKSLESEYDFVTDEVLEVIAIHELFELSEDLNNRNTKQVFNQEFVNIIQSIKSKSKDSIYDYLLNKFKTSNAKKESHSHSHGRKTTLEIIESVLVTNQCKEFRSRDFSKVNIIEEGDELNNMLIEYSRQPNEQAINLLMNKILIASELTDFQRNQVEVLRTYGYQPIGKAINLIEEKKFEQETTEYGRFLIFRLLTDQFVLLMEQDKKELKEILNNASYSNNYLSSPTSLKILARLMRERLSPENYKQAETKVIKPEEPHNKKELDSIRQVIEAEPRKPKFTRPEDRGQSFKNLSIDALLNKLSSTTDKIEQRKAAIEIGNKHIAGMLNLTLEEQEIVDDAVQRYIDTASDSNAQTREEGKLQIHRLWQVCIPKLIENLHNEDVAKLELASKSLILMQNEKAVKGLIEKMLTAPNSTTKNRLLFIMSKVQDGRETLISNRTPLSEIESNALYKRLLKPELEKHINK